MIRSVVFLCLVTLFTRPVSANDWEPQIRLMQTGGLQLIDDLKSIMSLTGPQDQQETKNLTETLEFSLKGMDLKKVMVMDLILGDGPMRYRPAFPLEDELVFWNENLNPNGIQKSRRYSSSLYGLRGAFTGYMRIRNGYAIFGEKKTDLPVAAPPPQQTVAHLLKLTNNAALEQINEAGAAAIANRLKSYNAPGGLRDELMQKLTKLKSESKSDFELRETLYIHQLNELERMYVEAAHALLVAKYDQNAKTGTMEFQLTPLPETAMAASVASLNQQPTSFANVPKAAKSNMSLRTRVPLDAMRIQHFTETFEVLRDVAYEHIEKHESKTPDQKAASKTAVDGIFKVLTKTAKTGLADGFLEAHPNADETNTAIAAFKTPDGNAPLAILDALEKSEADQKLKRDIAEESGVKIHSFSISETAYPGFKQFFGGFDILVGTSKDTIWMAAGPNAIEELKAAIIEVGRPNTGKASDPFFTLSGLATPWLQLNKIISPDVGPANIRKYREMLMEAGESGDDQFAITFNTKDKDIQGLWTMQPGWARFLGIFLADFSRDKLN